jgi:two-component system sensor histidine kinase YesM
MAKAKQNGKDKRTFSLRWTLMIFIFTCWVLPVFVILLVSGLLSARSTREHVSSIVTATVENAAYNVQRDIDFAIYSALNISYVPTIRLAYSQYQNTGNLTELNSICREFLSQQYSRSQVISAAYLLFPQIPNGEAIRCFAYNSSSLVTPQVLQFYADGSDKHAAAMMNDLDTNVGFFKVDDRFYLMRNLSLLGNRFTPYAMLITEINLESLFQRIGSIPWLSDASLYINDIPLAIFGRQIEQLSSFSGNREMQLHSFEQDRLLISAFIPADRYHFSYYVKADLHEMIQEMGNPMYIIWLITLISVPLLALVLLFFIRYISAPINQLRKLAGEIEGGKLGAQTDIHHLGSTEFVYLGSQMNAMSARLQYQFDCLYREELALQDARIKSLQSQINPHFLGNTLEIINWEARLAGAEKASQMMESLSTILRASLDRTGRPLIPLSEELGCIDAYLFIIQKRFGSRLEIKRDIDEQLLDWNVPRLILQPIVENAVEHGFSKQHHGVITIRAAKIDDEWMHLDVENDSEISPDDEAKVQQILHSITPKDRNSVNIGIRNVHQRLRILYGEKSGLVIRNDGKGNTISSMLIQNKQN